MKTKKLLYTATLCASLLISCTKEDNFNLTLTPSSNITKSFDYYEYQSNEPEFILFLNNLLDDWYNRNVFGCIKIQYIEGIFHYYYAEEYDLTNDEPLIMLKKITHYSFWQKKKAIEFAIKESMEPNKTVYITYNKSKEAWIVTVLEELPDEPAPTVD